jgi:RNA polymerase sigma-70 factor, ECF subfamily
MTLVDTEQAIARVRTGSVEDFRTVVVAFHPRLRAIIAELCPPGVEADEIAHCAFIEAYRRIDDYEANTNFFAWLTALARNLVRAECEKIRRRGRNERNYLDHLLAQHLDRAAQEDPAMQSSRAQFLAECVAQLKSDARALLAMRYREGWRVDVIARQLARSASAISVQLFAVRKLLRDCVRRKLAHAQIGIEPDTPHEPA